MRAKKAIINMATSMLYEIVAIICGLITPRLLISTFGSAYNGVVSSATQFLSMISILTIGITGATRVALYKTLAIDDTIGTSRIMKATKHYMRKVAIGVIIYAIVLSIVYPYISHSDLTQRQSAMLIIIVSIGTFAEYFFGISNQTLLLADQSSYVINILNALKTIANTICVAILIRFGSSIYVVKLASSFVFLISPVVMNVYVRRKYRLVTDCEPDNEGIRNRKAVAFHSIANIIHTNTDLFVLTLFADVKIVSVYTVYYLVVGKIKTLMQVFTNGMEAAFGNMWAKQEIDVLEKSFGAFEYMLFSFATIIFSCVGVLILPFISIYTQGVTDVIYVRTGLAVLITAAEALFCIRQPYLTLVYATGSYEETKIGAIIEAALNLGLSLILVQYVGINGVIIGTLAANLFRTIQFAVFISNNILNRSIFVFIKRIIWALANSLIIVPITLYIRQLLYMGDTWISWIVLAAFTLLVSCIITLISSFIFYKKDFQYLTKTLLFAIKRT